MGILFSKTTNGFYDTNIHGSNHPTDCVSITTEEHQALLDGQGHGKIISSDAEGRPLSIDPPPLTGVALIKQQILQLEGKATRRMVREAFSGSTNIFSGGEFAGKTSAEALTEIDNQIDELRAQL